MYIPMCHISFAAGLLTGHVCYAELEGEEIRSSVYLDRTLEFKVKDESLY